MKILTHHSHLPSACFTQEVYSQSVKVRKVAITKSIVEAIYSMEPPGRFLRKCATTGEWEELSKNTSLRSIEIKFNIYDSLLYIRS